jgi:hypothetical protein
MRMQDRFRRWRILLLQWQHWPWPIIYIPVLVQYFYHLLRFPGAGFPTLINRPFMALGGIVEESKLAIYQKVPRGWMPKTIGLPGFEDMEDLEAFLNYHQLKLPLIVKPDRGMRGKGVHLYRNKEDLLRHCRRLEAGQPHIIQSYADLDHEIGVFMIKAEDGWHITSLIERILPAVTGDGKSSVEELIRKDDQLFLHLQRWRRKPELQLNMVPRAGETIRLGQIGNHRLGTRFINRSDLITPELIMAMSRIGDLMKGFEYGRMDIRYRHWESFLELKDFQIIEVNGANSEPGHIYDKGFSLFEAWNILLKHHRIIYQKAKKARNNGLQAPDFRQSLRLFRQYIQTMKLP